MIAIARRPISRASRADHRFSSRSLGALASIVTLAILVALVTNASADTPPHVTAPASRTVAEGTPLLFGITASDADGDSIFALVGYGSAITAGGRFTPSANHKSGTFQWTPRTGTAGFYSVTFKASNALVDSATTMITVTGGSLDHPPIVNAPATAEGRELAQFTISVTASDPDGDQIGSLTASGSALSAGGSFTTNPTNTAGTFTWTPSVGQAGSYSVTFTASNALSGSTTTSITISPPDNPPVLTGVDPEYTVAEGSPLTINVLASDPDGTPVSALTASGSAASAGATFQVNPENSLGVFNWTPAYNQAGVYDVIFKATSNGLSDSVMATITVSNTDRPPALSGVPANYFGEESNPITIPITAADPDGNAISSLTATGSAIAAGGTFTSNAAHTSGTFSWTPSIGQAGDYQLIVTASNVLTSSDTSAIHVAGLTTIDLVTTTARAHTGIVFPLRVTDQSVAAILVPQLGTASDPTQWRLGHWSPADSSYLSADQGTLNVLDPGLGYWIATKDAKTIHMTGYPQTRDRFFLPLADGPGATPAWNQLGNPYSSAIAVNQLGVLKGPTIKPLTDATNTWTGRTVWIYRQSTGTYDSTSVAIPPLTMFWLKKLTPGDGYFLVVPHPGAAASRSAPPEARPSIDWELSIAARQGAQTTFPLTMGVAPIAEGFNSLDLALPPNPPGRALRLAIPKRDWGAMNDNYASEYKSAAARLDWDFSIDGMETPGEVTLTLSGRRLPPNLRLRLADLAHCVSWDVVPGQEIVLAAAAAGRRLRLTATIDGAIPPAVVARAFDAYPNPTHGAIGFIARLDRRSDVSVQVVDVAGRTVRTLSRRDASLGENVLIWDGRDESGAFVAPGIYLARYRAGAISATARVVRIR